MYPCDFQPPLDTFKTYKSARNITYIININRSNSRKQLVYTDEAHDSEGMRYRQIMKTLKYASA